MQGYTDPGVRRRLEADELDEMRQALKNRAAPSGAGLPSRAARRQAMAGGYETRPQRRPPAAARY